MRPHYLEVLCLYVLCSVHTVLDCRVGMLQCNEMEDSRFEPIRCGDPILDEAPPSQKGGMRGSVGGWGDRAACPKPARDLLLCVKVKRESQPHPIPTRGRSPMCHCHSRCHSSRGGRKGVAAGSGKGS
jgi:hypothetical protein